MSGTDDPPEKTPAPDGSPLGASRVPELSADSETDWMTEEIPASEARAMGADAEELTQEIPSIDDAPAVIPDLDEDPPTQQIEIDVTPRRYEVLESLEADRSGDRIRVRDRELGRTVVMKVLPAGLLASPSSLARFREEARTLARLPHPGIPPVFDMGTRPDGRVYFTVPEVPGRGIDEVARAARESGDPRQVRRALRWLLQASETVAFAHSKGVVHRALSPARVRIGSYGEVSVVGWGRPSRGGDPAWLAPEQTGGQPVGPGTDVFALGLLLGVVAAGDPRTPIDDAALETVRARALARDPGARYRHAGAFARAIADVLDR